MHPTHRFTDTIDTIASLRQSLLQLTRWGCRGFACSAESLNRVKSWSASVADRPQVADLTISGDCRRCNLYSGRRQVFAEENPQARFMIVCQPAGAHENRGGPFDMGAAGELLLRMIGAMKLTPDQVLVTHLVECRHLHAEQNLSTQAIRSCRSILIERIKGVRPKVICAMGEAAAQSLLDRKESIGILRGRFYDGHETKIMPTLDPAYLIDHPEAKGLAWEDLKKIMAYLQIAL